MSRKRAQRREDRRGLAQQLGVKAGDIPGKLLAHERTTTPRLHGSALTLAVVPTRWFQRSAAAELVLCLYVVDAQGPRLCRALGWSVTVRSGLHLVLEGTAAAKRVLDDTVRYRRPGHFVLTAALVMGDDATHAGGLLQGLPDWLREPAGLSFAAGDVGLDALVVSRCTTPQSALCKKLETQGYRATALSLLSLPAAGRVVSSCALPLVSADGSLRGSIDVDVRL